VLQGCHKSVTVVLQECHKVLQECYRIVTPRTHAPRRVMMIVVMVLQGCCKGVTRVCVCVCVPAPALSPESISAYPRVQRSQATPK
jgi:hypothetical protein